MKRIFDFMTAAAIVLAAAGCAKEIEGEIQVPEQQEDEAGTMVIGAELSDSPDADDVTKTLISDNGDKTYSVFWADGDQILVNGETSTNIDIDPDNKKSASFTLPVVEAPYCAVYPAGLYVKDSYKTVKEDSTVIEITIPSTQTYVENGFDPNAAIMTARGEAGGGLAFKHAMAYLKVAVTGTTVKSIRVNGNDNEALSGAYIISYSKSEVAFGPKKNEEGKAIGNTSATISCGESGVASGAPVFIAIPAREYKRGLTLTIVDAENHYQVVHSMKSFTAVPGKVYPTEIAFNAAGTYLEGGIYTVEDWNNFIKDLNSGDCSKWVKTVGSANGIHIMADIDYPYNLESAITTATLDYIVYGHDHTIKHHPVRPMFINVGENGGIFNLTIAGDTDKWDRTGWAGIFALKNSGQLRKCYNRVNLNLGKSAGDIILASGICRENGSTGYVMDCYNYGTITISEPDKPVRIGGILLYNIGGNFARCHNEGKIDVTGVNVGCVVGGVAYAVSGSAADLHNKGEISIDANLSASQTIYLGGVIANAEYNGVCSKLSGCSNSGALSIHKKGKFVMKGGAIGGVVAAINAGKTGTEGSTFTGFTNCSNSGRISFVEDETGGVHYAYAVGGVVGRCVNVKDVHYLNNGYYTVVRGAVNTGDIKVYTANGQKTALGNSGARQTYVGGIAGYMCGLSSVDKAIVRGKSTCTITTGSALGGDIAGGLVGGGAMLSIDTKPSATTIFKSYEGKPIGFLGAALGWVASKDYVSINGADVTATFELGAVVPVAKGFAGIVNTGKSLTITGCTYQGNAVTATDIYGGGTKTIK